MRPAPVIPLCFLFLLLAGGSLQPSAHAQDDVLSFISEPGDAVGQGETRSFPINGSGSDQLNLHVYANGQLPDHHAWLWLQAPPGQRLVPGVYEGASWREPNTTGKPQLYFSVDGRTCDVNDGRFEVVEAVYGPFDYIERFTANFEQYCPGSTARLYGEIAIRNPPPPPVLAVSITVDRKGEIDRMDGRARIHGTLTCTVPTVVALSGNYRQPIGQPWMRSASFGEFFPCGPTPGQWSYVFSGFEPFLQEGAGLLTLYYTSERDPNYPQNGSLHGTINETVLLMPDQL